MVTRVFAISLFGLAFSLLPAESGLYEGYTDIVAFRDTFIAVGTDGRIDRVSRSGESEPVNRSGRIRLNCAFSNDEMLIAAGDRGTIAVSDDGRRFEYIKPVTDRNIHGITFKNGLLIAGADQGTILLSEDGKSWQKLKTGIKGGILSLAAVRSFFIGITDAGEIIKSSDGIHWEIKNYNQEYAGYNRTSLFKKILAAQNRIVIIGTHDDGSPAILFSSLGNVWAERIPLYHDDDGMTGYLTEKPNDICYDSERDQFILACDNGELFTLPRCSKCSELVKTGTNDLNAILFADNVLLIAGSEYALFVQKL